MREITQTQFNEAAALFDQIDALRDQLTAAHTLAAKREIKDQIGRLIERRRQILEA